MATATEFPWGWAAISAGANSAAPLTSASSTAGSSIAAAAAAAAAAASEGARIRIEREMEAGKDSGGIRVYGKLDRGAQMPVS